MSEQAEAPIINFQGDLVGLGPIRREYIPLYQRWMNDFETTRFLEIQPRPMTLAQAKFHPTAYRLEIEQIA